MSPFDDKITSRTSLETSAHIGSLIRERRQQRGLTQHDLAERVGVGRQWISEVENGKPRAELELILKTLSALGLELRAHDTDSHVSILRNILPSPDRIVAAARRKSVSGHPK